MTEKNNFPIREDVSNVEGDKTKIGWSIYEIPPTMSKDEYYKERLSEEDFKKWKYNSSAQRLAETDRADYYREDGYNGGLGRHFTPSSCSSFGSISVLLELWGQPWNNLALNYVSALKPCSIRVSVGHVCLDSRPGRVTVIREA